MELLSLSLSLLSPVCVGEVGKLPEKDGKTVDIVLETASVPADGCTDDDVVDDASEDMRGW